LLAETIYKLMLYGFLMVLFAGAYAIFYAMGRFSRLPSLIRLSYIFALLQFIAGMGMVFNDYLDLLWKGIIFFSTVAYLFIPQAMWRVVVSLHRRHDH
jgi:hypothetical protein